MIDLDAVQEQADSFFHWAEGYGHERQANFAAIAKTLVAELRAAWEVIEATRDVGHGPSAMHWNPQCAQCRAVAAYDKVTGGK